MVTLLQTMAVRRRALTREEDMTTDDDVTSVAVRELRELRNVKHALDRAAIVAVTDARGRILDVNDRFCEIAKFTRDELIGEDHRIVNSGHHSPAFMSALWQRIAAGRVWRGELLNRAKDGGLYWVDTTIVPFLDENGIPYQYLAIHYDITDRKAAEAQLREQAMLAQVGEMAAVIAHEVKNPLAGIGGALQMIERQLPTNSAVLPVIGQIQERLRAVNQMVQDLMLFANPAPPCFAAIDAGEVIERAAALFGEHPRRGGTRIDVRPKAASDVVLRGDLEQLGLALAHVLINGAQAMDGRGRIALDVEVWHETCAFVVSDDGPGIPPEVQATLSRPFRTTKTRGLGVGVTIARRIVEEHGGALTFASGPGKGTVVTLQLPRHAA
jgi:PAS domain S-box-containing protein